MIVVILYLTEACGEDCDSAKCDARKSDSDCELDKADLEESDKESTRVEKGVEAGGEAAKTFVCVDKNNVAESNKYKEINKQTIVDRTCLHRRRFLNWRVIIVRNV